ncbi:uncharacterized protein TRIADDRAFT_61341 [Trichoplax adhaerens]|uniref:Alpha-1,3-mannosyl-glycoprotein 4-beta-N-acetylglucosaminyltransferase C n=1 Tax=Trichoplax adhaerens TaxID=10228 RepID=B3SAQ4_TRIAD|nr:hypothetical protein TRIADDRAFT_61341 [Trichoplax adhaerens]EDV20197.1 hypothetical protein TRIADDRAFT_61341 [Trichoplax adhaerens]|eukprot:XP_002117358.1 hypothetical protein TRIADDRAFT_61341 [Trichoplax adhaerens]
MDKERSLAAGHFRTEKGFLTIGIPTVTRPKANYLDKTILSIINNTNADEKKSIVIVIFLADLDHKIKDITRKRLTTRYKSFMKNGLIQIIQAPASYYPPLDNLKRNYGDSAERVRWRSKQCIDYAFLFEYCSGLSKYYLQLEDDVLSSEGFVTTIRGYINNQVKPWSSIHFAKLGFIGKLYRDDHLLKLAAFFKMFYDEQPIDYLIGYYSILRMLPKPLLRLPALFQHIGMESSLKGKLQPLREISFTSKRIYHGDNPPAKITSTFFSYGGGEPKQPYDAKPAFFWCKKPQAGHNMVIYFDAAINLTRVVIATGDPSRPNDIFGDASVQVSHSRNDKLKTCTNWITIGKFDKHGLMDVKYNLLREHVKVKIKCLRIYVNKSQRNWVIIREIAVWKHFPRTNNH